MKCFRVIYRNWRMLSCTIVDLGIDLKLCPFNTGLPYPTILPVLHFVSEKDSTGFDDCSLMVWEWYSFDILVSSREHDSVLMRYSMRYSISSIRRLQKKCRDTYAMHLTLQGLSSTVGDLLVTL